MQQVEKNIYRSTSSSAQLNEGNPELLINPTIEGRMQDLYLGRGSFAIVRLQMYRGLSVAVKEFLPHSILSDVLHEASVLVKLSHPFLPYFFGVCTSTHPLRIVTQYHGINCKPVTLTQEITSSKLICDSSLWLQLCIQILDC